MNKLEEIKENLRLSIALNQLGTSNKIYQDHVAWLIKRLEELEENIKQIHKEYGCELRDPNGTIWDHASELQERFAEANNKLKKLKFINSEMQKANKWLRRSIKDLVSSVDDFLCDYSNEVLYESNLFTMEEIKALRKAIKEAHKQILKCRSNNL